MKRSQEQVGLMNGLQQWSLVVAVVMGLLLMTCRQEPGQELHLNHGPVASDPESDAGTLRPEFTAVDPDRLEEYYRLLLNFSPRPAASARLEELRVRLQEILEGWSLAVTCEPFEVLSDRGKLRMVNLIAEKKGRTAELIYLGSHVDTKTMPGFEVIGANDSTSSTAALLELARIVADRPTRCTYRFAFFDGEEALGEHMTYSDGLYGSRHHAQRLLAEGRVLDVRAFILLDMIGDRDLRITRDTHSSPELWSLFVSCCNRLGYTEIVGDQEMAVLDDHIPFRELGIPAVDIIDFEYGPGNSLWHTPADVPENVSVESIRRVTEAVRCMLTHLENE
ncbi:MAG: Zn-dependent exopeptidase M28 [Acidobacteria bacterium]|nr:Zn-dependent exopeptidase M28 [Acidobacteriota bacterium]